MPDVGATGIQPPYLDPSQYPNYLDVQRKQLIANMLLGAMQRSNQTPQDWNSMKVVPRRGLMTNLAPLVSGLMAVRGLNAEQQAEQNYFQGLYGGAPTTQGAPSAPPNASAGGPSGAAPASPQAPSGVAQPPSGGVNPMLLTGDPRTSQMIMGLTGPQKYGEAIAARYQPTDFVKTLTAAGIDPNSPLGRQLLQRQVAKAGVVPPIDVRPGGTLVDPFTQEPTFTAPANNVQTVWGPNGPVAAPVAGGQEAEARGKALDTAAQQANTPHYEPDPFHPGQARIVYPPGASAPTGTPSATPPGAAQAPHPAAPPSTGSVEGNSALALEQQKQQGKSGAESGQAYSDQLVKNAVSATEVRRSLAELRNLSTTGGVSVANPAKLELGSYLVAAGMDPKTVGSMLGTDVGALTAASKQTGSLALDSIHDMTSRGTNFDLATFMKYNPNLNMANKDGFLRVLDFMDKRMQQDVAKQADFDQWSRNTPSDRWASGHTTHWLQLQNQLIDKGKTNSRPPLSSFVTP